MTTRIGPEAVQERFDRLGQILGDIVERAGAQATERCPYRNRHDRCTAGFRCRHQRRVEAVAGATGDLGGGGGPAGTAAGQPTCTHDGTLDYRSAWESNPQAAAGARKRLAGQRRRRAGDQAP